MRRYVDRTRLRDKRVLARTLRRQSTPEERALWQCLRRNQAEGVHFRRQHGYSGFIMDFYCPRARLAVELDGDHHLQQIEADQHREKILQGMGIHILRFRNQEVRQDLPGVIDRITAEIKKRI